jgi:hypothetical protein
MVRWNAGPEHVVTQLQPLSLAGPKIEIQMVSNVRLMRLSGVTGESHAAMCGGYLDRSLKRTRRSRVVLGAGHAYQAPPF